MVQRYDLAKNHFPNLGKKTKSPCISSSGENQEVKGPVADVHGGELSPVQPRLQVVSLDFASYMQD